MADKKKAVPAAPAPTSQADGAVEGEEGAVAPAPRFGKKQKIMAAGAAVLLLGGGGGAAALLMGGGKEAAAKDGHGEKADAAKAAEEEKAAAEEEAASAHEGGEGEGKGELPLVDVPAMIVNLRTENGDARYLKLRFMIEARNASKVDAVTKKLPAIIDSFQPFLRELRPEDLNGSAAVYRIKEELLVRSTTAVGPGMVKDVLIQDLVQQ